MPGARESADVSAPPTPPIPLSAPVPSQRPESGAGRAISALLLLSALSLGAYAIWLYVLHPPGTPQIVRSATPKAKSTASAVSPAAASAARAAEADTYAQKIGHAQDLLAAGDGKGSLDAFKEAMKGGTPVARSVLSHMQIAIEEPSGPCKLTGIGRPRPYGIDVPVSRPTLIHSSAGTVFVWIDNHQDPKKKQAYAVLLDDALRRASAEVSLTPEASSARQAQLIPAGDNFALLWWDDGGSEPGVYTRLISHDGHIAGPPRRISSVKKGDLFAALTPNGNKFWAAWQEEVDKGSSDIMARELDADLTPLGEPVRLTALLPAKAAPSAAGTPALAVQNGHLYVAFSVNRGAERIQMYVQRIALNDATLKTGLLPLKKQNGKERFLGQAQLLSSKDGKNTTPVLACTADGCYVAWDDEKAGRVRGSRGERQGADAVAPGAASQSRAPGGGGERQHGGHLVVRRIAPAHGATHARRPGRGHFAQPREWFSADPGSGGGRKARPVVRFLARLRVGAPRGFCFAHGMPLKNREANEANAYPGSQPIAHLLSIPSRATVRRSPVEAGRIVLVPLELGDGGELWDAVDNSRWHLERWLPWVPFNNAPEASVRYAEACVADWDAGRAVRFAIRDRQSREFLGVVGLDSCVHLHRSCELGYWLRRKPPGAAS